MDKVMAAVGLLIVIMIVATGGFGLFSKVIPSLPLPGFFSSGPRADGPDGSFDFRSEDSSENGEERDNGEPRSASEKSDIRISSVSRSAKPDSEYLVITRGSGSGAPIAITGWRVSNSTGRNYAIEDAAKIPFVSDPVSVQLKPGEVAYIHTGRSPTGFGFQENICSGWFSRNYKFTPSVSGSCPAIEIPNSLAFNDACLRVLESNRSSCRIPDLDSNEAIKIRQECTDFIAEKFNYRSCVDAHRGGANFFRKNWHIYLDRTESLWRELHDEITLRDENGNVVSVYKY